jgi:peptidoglycan L-alanyl-D-glutamate endopeptidase CwlK
MINSRKIEDLTPVLALLCKQFIDACAEKHIDILITSTYRDFDCQAELYAQGRTKLGRRITNARPGYSAHNFKRAFDFVPLVNGKADWKDINTFKRCGEIGKALGLEYAGDWKTFREYCHFQFLEGKTLAQLRAEKADG